MKLLLAFSITLFMTNLSFGQATMIDKVVAQVGDNVILLSEIQAQKLQAIQAGMDINPNTDCQILEEIMFQYLDIFLRCNLKNIFMFNPLYLVLFHVLIHKFMVVHQHDDIHFITRDAGTG
mgnify:CR=1 FL=1